MRWRCRKNGSMCSTLSTRWPITGRMVASISRISKPISIFEVPSRHVQGGGEGPSPHSRPDCPSASFGRHCGIGERSVPGRRQEAAGYRRDPAHSNGRTGDWRICYTVETGRLIVLTDRSSARRRLRTPATAAGVRRFRPCRRRTPAIDPGLSADLRALLPSLPPSSTAESRTRRIGRIEDPALPVPSSTAMPRFPMQRSRMCSCAGSRSMESASPERTQADGTRAGQPRPRTMSKRAVCSPASSGCGSKGMTRLARRAGFPIRLRRPS